MDRRVVITGLGALTPIGQDIASFWDNLKNGVIFYDSFFLSAYSFVGLLELFYSTNLEQT